MRIRAAFILVALGACSAPEQGTSDAEVAAEAVDGVVADEGNKPEASTSSWKRPAGSAAIRFMVDDTANQTYKDGQMKWTGSFRWSAADNTIVYSSAWQPTDGPFPVLYDDGPYTSGGHEPVGAVAGDHKFECEVWFVAEEATTFEYGVLNEVDRWIWIGPNGTVDVPKGSTDDLVAAPLVLPKFGNIDVQITLDTSKLHQDFSTITPADYLIYLKTSANSWFPAQLLDNGQNGDAKAGDGIFTYRQSVNLGAHDGLLAPGQHMQFVFVFAMPDVSPDDGSEYKVGTVCPTEGVAAYSNRLNPDEFAPEPIVLERDSRGKVFNTTIILGEGGPWCLQDEDCYSPAGGPAATCDKEKRSCTGGGTPPVTSSPSIAMIDPNKGPVSGGTEVTISGKDFREGCTVDFGGVPASSTTFVSSGEVKAVTPASKAGTVTVTLANPDGGKATCPNCFEFVEGVAPKVPDWGKLDPPLLVSTYVGVETEPMYAEVYAKGVTEGGSNGEPVLLAQFGMGPAGSDPRDPLAAWTFVPAVYDHSTGIGDNNAVFTASVVPDAGPKTLAFTFRFSLDGGATWLYVDSDGASPSGSDFSVSGLGKLEVGDVPDQPVVLSVEPGYGPMAGGTQVQVKGLAFGASPKVVLDGAEVQTSVKDANTVIFTTPAHPMGRVDVTVKSSEGKEGTLKGGFAFVPVGTLTVEGPWDAAFRVGTNDIASDWNAPDKHENELHELYVAVDDSYLHVGVKGFCQATNAIVGWLDRDPGAGTGFAPASLTDGGGALDNAISAPSVDVTVPGFGAEFAFGSVGMSATDKMSDKAGWRAFFGAPDVGPGNFAWLEAPVAVSADAQALLASLPLSTLSSGMTGGKLDVGLFVRIVNADGNAASNQCLPGQDGPKVEKVVVVPVR